MFAHELEPHIKPALNEDEIRKLVDERVSKIKPRTIKVKTEHKETDLDGEHVHAAFDNVMSKVSAGRKNILLVGPAGTGKTTLARQVAKAMELNFGFISLSAGVTETHLFGRILPQSDGSWKYQPSKFVQVYAKGGVFLFDEIDAADANVMVAVNAALANGMFANPVSGDVVERHKKCIIIGAANTWGCGADAQYVGRNQLDAATLDRFVLATAKVDYDTKLEAQLIRGIGLDENTAKALEEFAKNVRKGINNNGLRRVCSTRFMVHAAEAIVNGASDLEGVSSDYFVNWTADELARVGV